jgi:fibro-slime domain-containing protein
MMTTHFVRRAASRLLSVAVVLALAALPRAASAQDSIASAELTWNANGGNTVAFTLNDVLQLFSQPPAGYVGTATGTVMIDFGDGTTIAVAPTVQSYSYSGSSNIDRAYATATFGHSYAAAGVHPIVRATLCCRSVTLGDGNAGTSIQLTTAVSTPDPALVSPPLAASPVLAPPSITRCVPGQACTVAMAGISVDGSPIAYRLATTTESGMAVQTAGTIDPATGVFTFTPPFSARFQQQVIATSSTGSTAVDFVISANDAFTAPPTFTSPACGTSIPYYIATPITVPVTVTGGSTTTLYSTALTFGASLAAGMQPGSYVLNWPASLGAASTSIQLSAVSATGGQTNCIVTFTLLTPRLEFISGLIRDFSKTQPDFASADGDAGTTLVSPTLGADLKPVFAPNGTPATVASAASFHQWFNATPTRVTSFTLSNEGSADPKLLTFTANPFYPIDGQLGGNQGDAHNNYFTYEAHINAAYAPGTTLTFSSADDLWVFVNNTLALDLGGVHAAETGTLSIDAALAGQHAEIGQPYQIHLFYAHRGSGHVPSITLQLADFGAVCDVLPGVPWPVDFAAGDISALGRAVALSTTTLQMNASSAGPTTSAAWAEHNGVPFTPVLADGFSTEFDVTMTAPAEGLAFVVQSQSPVSQGAATGNIGYGGIAHSLAVELDAHYDSALLDPIDSFTGLPYEHAAINSEFAQQNSASHSPTGASLAISTSPTTYGAATPFDDGKTHHIRIEYRPILEPAAGGPRLGWLYVYYDSQYRLTSLPIAQAQIDGNTFASAITSGGAAFIGFTSSSDTGVAGVVTVSNWTFTEVAPDVFGSYVNPPPGTLVGQASAAILQAAPRCAAPMYFGGWGSSFGATMAKGAHTVPVTIVDHGDSTYAFDYTPDAEGLWTLTPAFRGANLGSGPYTVTVNAQTALTVSPVSGTFGQPATFSARLSRAYDGTPLAGQPVAFTLGAQQVTATTDASGVAQTVLALAAGFTSYQASFAGNAGAFLTSTNSAASVTGSLASTSLTYGGPTTINSGDTLNASATLSSAFGPVAGGTVTFTLGTLTVTGVTDVNGIASATLANVTLGGSQSLIVAYGGSATNATSARTVQVLINVRTSLAYTGAASGTFGQPFVLAARLTATATGIGVTGELVTFTLPDQTTVSATTDVTGLALATASSLAAGDDAITAAFAGDTVNGLLTSSTNATIHLGAATTALAYTGTTVFTSGGSLALSATLTAGGVPVSGQTVTFTIDAYTATATTNASGIASAAIPNVILIGGVHTVTSSFVGTSSYVGASTSMAIGVLVPTTLSYVGVVTGIYGQAATLVAHLVATPTGAPVANETVTFQLPGPVNYPATTDVAGNAAVTLTGPDAQQLHVGNTIIVATFSGDSTLSLIAAPQTPVTIHMDAQTALAAPQVTGTIGQQTSIGTTLTRAFDGQFISGETVTFTIGGTPVSAVTGAGGVAQAAVTLPAGVTQYQVTFGGDAGASLLASANTGTVVATRAASTITFMGANTATTGTPLTVTAALATTLGPVAGESLTFTFGGVSLVTITDLAGRASATFPDFPAAGGPQPLNISFAGNATDAPASVQPQIIVKIATAVAYTGATTGTFGQPFTLSGRLTAVPSGAPLANESLLFEIPGPATFPVTTDAGGNASITLTGSDLAKLQVGNTNILVGFAGDAATNTLATPPVATAIHMNAPSTLTYTGPTTFVSPGPLSLSATLAVAGASSSGQTVSFAIDSYSASGITATDGTVSVALPSVTLTAGPHTVTITFAGGGNILGANASGTMAVSRRTALTYSGATSGSFGAPLTVAARLTTVPDGQPVAGASVLFATGASQATATTDVNGLAQASLSSLPLGSDAIAISFAGSATSLASTTSANVSIADTTPPVIGVVSNVVAEATAATGAIVTLATPTATDNVDAAPVVSLTPTSGTRFALGTTTVTVRATDAAGNAATATFTVTVRDTTPPILTLPANIEVTAAGPVTFTATAADLVDGTDAVTCAPASGSAFAVGTTTVSCNTTDRAGNAAHGTFIVTVDASVVTPDGIMFGQGHMDEGTEHDHFAFRVSQLSNVDFGRLEYWTIDTKKNRTHPDDTYGVLDTGDFDSSYGNPHGRAVNMFVARTLSVTFLNDPALQPGGNGKRAPTVDTVTIVGTGYWNGRAGYTYEAHATDQGEPGKGRDTFAITIKDPAGVLVASVNDTLDGGNIQSSRLPK